MVMRSHDILRYSALIFCAVILSLSLLFAQQASAATNSPSCVIRQGSCISGESAIFSLYQQDDSHLSAYRNGPYYACCPNYYTGSYEGEPGETCGTDSNPILLNLDE